MSNPAALYFHSYSASPGSSSSPATLTQSRMLASYPFADASKPLCSMTESRLRHEGRTAQDSKALLILSCQEVVLFQVEQLRNPSSGKTKVNLKFSAPFADTMLGCTSLLLLLTVSREGGVHSYAISFTIFFLHLNSFISSFQVFDRQLGSSFLFKLISFVFILSVTTLYNYSSCEIR